MINYNSLIGQRGCYGSLPYLLLRRCTRSGDSIPGITPGMLGQIVLRRLGIDIELHRQISNHQIIDWCFDDKWLIFQWLIEGVQIFDELRQEIEIAWRSVLGLFGLNLLGEQLLILRTTRCRLTTP